MNSRNKGKVGEREWAGICRDHGYECRRDQQFNGLDGADVVGLPHIHIEVKRVERLNMDDAMLQSVKDRKGNEKPIVAHRRNRGPWMVTMLADDWFALYSEWEAGK